MKNAFLLTRAGITATLYVVLTFATLNFASGFVQLRLSEALTILPLLFPETSVALFVGCIIANLITGCAPYDIVFGSLITLLSALLTAFVGKKIKNSALKVFVGGLFPVLMNAFLLPVVWYYVYGKLKFLYIVQVLILLVSQSISVYAVGYPLYYGVNKIKNKINV